MSEAPAITQDAIPTPRMRGRFNLYDTPDGGIHVSYQEDPKNVDEDGTPIDEPVQHIDIPGQAIKMMKMMESGQLSPMKALGMLKGMFGG